MTSKKYQKQYWAKVKSHYGIKSGVSPKEEREILFQAVKRNTLPCKILMKDNQHRVHCQDGPAVITSEGVMLWAIHGEQILNINLFMKLAKMSDEEKMIFKLKYTKDDFCP